MYRYLSNLEEREEGGTPDLVGSVRAALALRLKRLCGGPDMVKSWANKGAFVSECHLHFLYCSFHTMLFIFLSCIS